MEKIIFRLIIVTSSCSFSAKHVFIKDKLPWLKAQEYCREKHTDLSPITSELEQQLFIESVGEEETGWIGLHWDSPNQPWSWSGGATVTQEPRLTNFSVAVLWTRNGWVWNHHHTNRSFFCLNLAVVPEEKTWEEALDHCRGAGNDLASLLSQSESLLVQTQIQHSGVSGPVWTGLRYLGDRWMWVNGDPLEYEAWTGTGDREDPCPLRRRCGALTPEGTWEDRDCGEKLSFVCA